MPPKPKTRATRASEARHASRDAKGPALQPGPPAPPSAPKELLLLSEVVDRTRLSDTTLWRLEKAGRFPKRIKIGFKRVAWRAHEIDAWVAAGIDAWVAGQSLGEVIGAAAVFEQPRKEPFDALCFGTRLDGPNLFECRDRAGKCQREAAANRHVVGPWGRRQPL